VSYANIPSPSARRTARDSSRAGQALVEFAIVVPILLLILLGIVDFARAWNVYEVLTDAAREGAREWVVDNGKDWDVDIVPIIQAAGARAGIAIDASDVTKTEPDGPGKGNPAVVRIEYQHRLNWVGIFMGMAQGDRDLTLITEFVMRNE
jgi:Flp pilus assembly protein TadG